MQAKDTPFEIERIRWLLDRGHPQYALCRVVALIAHQRVYNLARWLSEKCTRASLYLWMYRRHVLFEYGFVDQVMIILDFVRRSVAGALRLRL